LLLRPQADLNTTTLIVLPPLAKRKYTMAASTSLFQVYLRLRPPIQSATKDKSGPWLVIEAPNSAETNENMSHPTHVTLQPPNESRKRAIERFGFTKIFKEEATQLEVFDEIKVAENVKSVLQTGRDGLIATLGVTGSGKVWGQKKGDTTVY
jgi:hypothetical protein